jgi:ribonuclease P protein component
MPISFSFPQSIRLKTAEEFSTVFKQAKKLHYREFSVYVRSNNLNYPRLGLAVSKKSAKKAVTRNLIKRIVRENFRLNQEYLKGWDIVFVAKYAAGQSSKQQLHAVIQSIWQRLVK